MPTLLMHIDYIGRQKGRTVLAIEFHDFSFKDKRDYRLNEDRRTIVAWFDANQIPYQECGCYANEMRMESYRGQIYIDVPYDGSDPLYQKLEAYLENSDGSMKFQQAWFRAYSLDACLKNAHHDTPGFWEENSEGF
jgi:hypothetical protein